MIWIYTLLFAFVLYADALRFIPMINYWDEGLAIVIILLHAIKKSKRGMFKIKKEKGRYYLLILFVLAMGLCGNLLHPGIQTSSEAIWKDVIAFLKFPLLMTILINDDSTWYDRHREKILKKIAVFCRISIMIAAITAVIGYIIDIGVYTDEVRYIKCYQFVFSHPTFLVANLVFCISILIMEDRKKNKWYIYMTCVLLFLTQRFKAYAIIAIILALMLLKDNTIDKLFSFKWKTKLRAKYFVPVVAVVGVIIFLVFRNRFATYLSWGMTSARLALIVVCFQIAKDFFPFGSGFGTFASFLSGRFYSGIYSMYGLSNVSGLRIDQYNFISDTFWPWVIGQFGFIAAVAYVGLYVLFIREQMSGIKKQGKLIAFIVMWLYALLASTMEAFFTNATGVSMAVILMIFIGRDEKISRNKVRMSINNERREICE